MSLQTIVTSAPLTDEVKEYLLDRITNEGETADVIATVKEALQEYIDAGFKTMGIEVDPNDPRVVAAKTTRDTEIQSAMDDLDEEIENLSIDAAVVHSQANKSIETLQVNTLKTQLAE